MMVEVLQTTTTVEITTVETTTVETTTTTIMETTTMVGAAIDFFLGFRYYLIVSVDQVIDSLGLVVGPRNQSSMQTKFNSSRIRAIQSKGSSQCEI
mmetsp:Transcript_41136/g.99128  ORF Transcript_41136/g.99128 Transcript_41136/m.99128 type:complete len:96 (+) Transcript_41136:521-808(+)